MNIRHLSCGFMLGTLLAGSSMAYASPAVNGSRPFGSQPAVGAKAPSTQGTQVNHGATTRLAFEYKWNMLQKKLDGKYLLVEDPVHHPPVRTPQNSNLLAYTFTFPDSESLLIETEPNGTYISEVVLSLSSTDSFDLHSRELRNLIIAMSNASVTTTRIDQILRKLHADTDFRTGGKMVQVNRSLWAGSQTANGYTSFYVASSPLETNSKSNDQALADQLAEQAMQQALKDMPPGSKVFTGSNAAQQAQQYAKQQLQKQLSNASSTTPEISAMNQWLETHIGIPASVLPTHVAVLKGGDYKEVVTSSGAELYDPSGKLITPSYMKTISGSGYSITYAVIAGMLYINVQGNVPSSLLPPSMR